MSSTANVLSESSTAGPNSENLYHHLLLRSCCYDHHQPPQLHQQRSLPVNPFSARFTRARDLVPLEILGHRGAGCSVVGGESLVPENSIAAFERAVELGLTAVEIDVWLTADNEVVVLHGVEDDGFLYETVAVPVGSPTAKPQRIELLNYSDWSKAGLLRHRQPWPLFVTSSTQSTSSTSIQLDEQKSEGHDDITTEELAACSCCSRVMLLPATDRRLAPDLSKAKTAATATMVFRHMNTTQRENERLRYFEAAQPFWSNNEMISEVPLLSTVFAHFHGRLQFNVELKGTNPLLGTLVLEIARRFPGIVSRISSFHWKVPVHPDHELFGEAVTHEKHDKNDKDTAGPASGDECPGGKSEKIVDARVFSPNKYFSQDLLMPLVANNDSIPLALLFEGDTLPSVPAIISSMRHYKATWAHVPQMFHLSSTTDQAQVAKLRVPFLSNPRVQKVLNQLTCSCQDVESDNSGSAEALSTATVNRRNNTIEALVTASLNLAYLTWSLQAENLRVLVYSGHINEHPAAMQLALLCGIDGVCVNDISSTDLLSTMCRNLLAEL